MVMVASGSITSEIVACMETTQLQETSMNTGPLCIDSKSDGPTPASPSGYKGSGLPVKLWETGFHTGTSEPPCPVSQA